MRSLSLEELDKLQIDESGQLYWDGVKVVTESVITLSWWVDAAVIVTGVAALGMFVVMLLTYCTSRRAIEQSSKR